MVYPPEPAFGEKGGDKMGWDQKPAEESYKKVKFWCGVRNWACFGWFFIHISILFWNLRNEVGYVKKFLVYPVGTESTCGGFCPDNTRARQVPWPDGKNRMTLPLSLPAGREMTDLISEG